MPSTRGLSFRDRTAIAIAIILLAYPLLTVIASGNLQYYLNVVFYSQRIFLISALFIFLSYVVLKDRLDLGDLVPQDADDTAAYAIISFILILFVASLHVDFDALLRMESMEVGSRTAGIGFGWLLADAFELDRAQADSEGIRKEIELAEEPDDNLTLRLHGGWEGNGSFASTVAAYINGRYAANLTDSYAELGNGEAGWVDASVPASALAKGWNTVDIRASGPDYVFVSSQWVYHDGRTLRPDGSYYGQEALVYLKDGRTDRSFFRFAFWAQALIKLLAVALLAMAVFGKDTLARMAAKNGRLLLTLAVLSIATVSSVLFIQDQWTALSLMTGKTISYVLSGFGDIYSDLDDRNGPVIGLNDFYIRVFKSCSGVESLGVFTLLGLVMVCHNWRRVDKAKIAAFMLVGILGTFLVNVLRIICLLAVGAFFSRELAINAFHTNLGWIIMLGYFALFSEVALRYSAGGDKTDG